MNSAPTETARTENDSPVSPESGVREHLLQKARQCEHDWRTGICRLADAEGNEVFKSVLLLNCIECHGYVTQTELQALQSFRWSIRAAVAGFVLVIATFLSLIILPMFLENFKGEITTISLVATVLTTFISSIFFYLYRESLKRMESFHNQLREVQKVVFGLFLKGISESSAQSDEERREILRFLMPSDENKRNHPEEHIRSNEAAA
jgi:hypothetical protein